VLAATVAVAVSEAVAEAHALALPPTAPELLGSAGWLAVLLAVAVVVGEREDVALEERLLEAVGERLAGVLVEGLGVGLSEAEGLAEGLVESVAGGVKEGVEEGVGEGMTVGVPVGVGDGVLMGVASDDSVDEGERVLDTVPLGVALAEGEAVPVALPVGEPEPDTVGVALGVGLGVAEGGAQALSGPGEMLRTLEKPLSITSRRPARSTSSAVGSYNSALRTDTPSPKSEGTLAKYTEPVPAAKYAVLLGYTFQMRRPYVSAMKRFPHESRAMPPRPV